MLSGVIVEMGPNWDCRVRLPSGELVMARIPRHVARLMFRVLPGDRVAVEQRGAGKYVVLGHEQTIIDARCVARLTRDGRVVSDWFLIGDLICFRGPQGDIGELLSSDDVWSEQLRDYLRRAGAPHYSSHTEMVSKRSAGCYNDPHV